MKRILLLTALALVLLLGIGLYANPFGAAGLVSAQEGVEVPFLEAWSGSGHADAEAEAFTHWNEDDPQEIPTSCAKCHSTPGYLDFLGADGSEAGVVDDAAPVGTTVECVACHNDVTLTKTSVVMPSGIELTGLGDESRCMECHQGRQSKVSVDEAIAGLDEDTVSEDLGFLNIHYFAAAATKYGTLAKGGYEYDGMSYDGNFGHVEAYDTCIECHNMHTLELKVEECSDCHSGITSVEDLKDVRMYGSLVDYDGDGNVDEGIYYELEGLQEMLYQAIQAYANEVSGTAIAYNAASHPYFFIDANGDGEAGEDETDAYNAWTPRLLKAAYNYQTSVKDPGAYAHGGKYIIELLYDSIADLNTAIAEPVDLSNAHRIDHGHFAGSEEAFRHWDEDDPQEVPGSCSKCHSAAGLPILLENGLPDSTSIAQPVSNGLQCSTCHNDLERFSRYEITQVEFPSGVVIDSGDENMNLCMECHQGRESTVSVNGAIEASGAGDDEVSDELGFRNVHYFAAAATLFGSEVMGAYQYDGKEYVGRNDHIGAYDSCTECHNTHQLEVKFEECADCHGDEIASEETLVNIRESSTDYDGDGDTDEGLAAEIETMNEALYAALQAYAADTVGTPIEYNPDQYPYFFNDAGEAYASWTPRLLKGAYNYQYAQKDPGAFAHNGVYVIQFLYDSIEDLGGDVSGMTRP
jgi:hypothetical protein